MYDILEQINHIIIKRYLEKYKCQKNKYDELMFRKNQILSDYKALILFRDRHQCVNPECEERGNEIKVYQIYLPSYAFNNLVSLCNACSKTLEDNKEKYKKIVYNRCVYKLDEIGKR